MPYWQLRDFEKSAPTRHDASGCAIRYVSRSNRSRLCTRAGLERYFGYYNGTRRYSRLGDRTPDAVYRDLLNNPSRLGLPLPAKALTPRPCS